MKKFNLTVASLVVVVLMAGCGGGKASGDVYSTEVMSVVAPSGWKVFPYYVLGSSTETREDILGVYKGAKEPIDQMSTPGLVINYFSEAKIVMTPPKSWYEDVVDIEPFTLGNYTWEGFTGTRSDMPQAICWTTNAVELFQVVVWLENGGKKLSFDDADVQSIIASISAK